MAMLLGACSSLPKNSELKRETIENFSLESRFSLSVKLPDQAPQSGGGRLSWTHRYGSNKLFIANPLGFAIAEIETTPERSVLRLSDGKISESPDPDLLIEEVTGQRLPVTSLAHWLLGRAHSTAHITYDAQQRPTSLVESGWQVNYQYEDESRSALPSRLTLNHKDEIELRLRIEEWKENP